MENTNFKVDVSKDFSVPVDQLYDAWTSTEKLKQWWKPMNKTLTEVVNDIKEGGTVKYLFSDNSLVIEGKYLEVKPKEKLVYTWDWDLPADDVKDSAYKLTIEFSKKNNQLAIHVIQENFENEEGTLPHKQGWEKGLEDLDKFLQSEKK